MPTVLFICRAAVPPLTRWEGHRKATTPRIVLLKMLQDGGMKMSKQIARRGFPMDILCVFQRQAHSSLQSALYLTHVTTAFYLHLAVCLLDGHFPQECCLSTVISLVLFNWNTSFAQVVHLRQALQVKQAFAHRCYNLSYQFYQWQMLTDTLLE